MRIEREQIPTVLQEVLSALYGGGVSLRNALYDSSVFASREAPLPVVSVGNVTAGGSGKTPFAAFLARSLGARGFRPVVVTRGYGGGVKGPHLVIESDEPESVGDETVLHRTLAKVPIVVARDRVSGANFVSEKKLGDVILLDDGFQHRRLKRDLDLVLVDLSRPFNGLLPRGDLREDPEKAFRRASGVLFVRRKGGVEGDESRAELFEREVRKILPTRTPAFHVTLRPGALVDVWSGEEVRGNLWSECVALTAIAAPDQFFRTLLSIGFTTPHVFSFPDHHPFTVSEWRRARSRGLPVVCTEKDAVKLRRFLTQRGELFSLGQEVEIEEEGVFFDFVCSRLRTRREGIHHREGVE